MDEIRNEPTPLFDNKVSQSDTESWKQNEKLVLVLMKTFFNTSFGQYPQHTIIAKLAQKSIVFEVTQC